MVLREVQRVDSDRVPSRVRRLYVRASSIALLGNMALLAGKAVAASVTGSSAMYADAANSAADVAYSLLMGLGLWLSLRPADESHPHGHRRFEPLVSIMIGVAMVLAGVEAARQGIATWRQGPEPITSVWAIIVPIAVVLAKAGMYLWVNRIARAAMSPALRASARDNIMDSVSSGMALVGILASRYITELGDPLAALLVAGWIFYGAYGVLRESVGHLTGGAASPGLTQAVVDAACEVPGVLDVHQVIIEYVGPLVRADIHIDMHGWRSLNEVHAVSDAVREAVEAMDEVDHAFVHVEPIEDPAVRTEACASGGRDTSER